MSFRLSLIESALGVGGNDYTGLTQELRAHGLKLSDLVNICKQYFQEAAEESDASDMSLIPRRWRHDDSDGGAPFDVWQDEIILKEHDLLIELDGKGYATRSGGNRGDFDTSPDAGDCDYTVKFAKVTLFQYSTLEDDDTALGTWDIAPFMNK